MNLTSPTQAVSMVGMVLGDRWAREDAAERFLEIEQMVEQLQRNADARIAADSLAIAKALRGEDADSALAAIETGIERQRAAIAANATGLDTSILKSIEEYQAAYPWSPPSPSPEESELVSRFGRLTPTIQDGTLIGFRVWNVQPGRRDGS